MRRTVAVVAAFTLTMASGGVVAQANDDLVFAEVSGHAAGTSANNQASTWDEDGSPACFKIEDTRVDDKLTYLLGEDYRLVVVKSADDNALDGEFSNTLFENAMAEETVWADTNGNEMFDPDSDNGDKEISHIIFCPKPEPEDATLTLVKKVDNGETGATTAPEAWTLSADGPTSFSGVANSAAVTDVQVTAGEYTPSESGPDGYTPGDWMCKQVVDQPNVSTFAVENGASSTATIGPGEDWVCTITNTAIPPKLTLIKELEGEGPGAVDDFELTATGPDTISGLTGDEEVTGAVVQVGDYVLSESTDLDGYTSLGWMCEGGSLDSETDTVSIGVGEDVTCIVVNTPVPPPPPEEETTLTLVKEVEGEGDPADWTLTATLAPDGPAEEWTSPFEPKVVDPGEWTLSETGPEGFEEDYEAGDWTCENIAGDGLEDVPVSDGDTITLEEGDQVECTIVNTFVPPPPPEEDVDFVKAEGVCIGDIPYLDWAVTVENFETAPTEFTLQWVTVDGNEAGDAAGIPVGDPIVIPVDEADFDPDTNTYSGRQLWFGASEDPVDWPGWVLENGIWIPDPDDPGGNLRPDAALEVTVNPSDETLTFYPSRSDDPDNPCDPPENAELALIKQVINDDARPDGPKSPDDFTLTATNQGDSSIVYDGPSAGLAAPGTYTLTEKGVDGWSLVSWQCVSGDASLSVLHGIPDATVDVWVDGALYIDNFTPGSLEPAAALPPGPYEVSITGPTAADADSDVILGPAELALGAGIDYTAVAHLDDEGKPALSVYVNDEFPGGSGDGKVTVRHLADAPEVEITANGASLGSFSNTDELGPFTLAGGTKLDVEVLAGTTVVTSADVTVTADVNTIVYAWGTAADLKLAIQTVDLVAPSGETGGTVTLAEGESKSCIAINDDIAIAAGPQLPATGAETVQLAALSGVLVASGAGALALARRRGSSAA